MQKLFRKEYQPKCPVATLLSFELLDREQIGKIGERMFDKNRSRFMNTFKKTRKKRLDTFRWISNPVHQLRNKFWQINLANALLIPSV